MKTDNSFALKKLIKTLGFISFISFMAASYIEGLPSWTYAEHFLLFLFSCYPESVYDVFSWLTWFFAPLYLGVKYLKNLAKITKEKNNKK